MSELTSKLAVRRHAILEARGVRLLTTLTPYAAKVTSPNHRQVAASITGLSGMNGGPGGCVTCRVWSQAGALFAALCAAVSVCYANMPSGYQS